MACIVKKPLKNRISYFVDFKDADGRRRRKAFDTEADAQEFLQEIKQFQRKESYGVTVRKKTGADASPGYWVFIAYKGERRSIYAREEPVAMEMAKDIRKAIMQDRLMGSKGKSLPKVLASMKFPTIKEERGLGEIVQGLSETASVEGEKGAAITIPEAFRIIDRMMEKIDDLEKSKQDLIQDKTRLEKEIEELRQYKTRYLDLGPLSQNVSRARVIFGDNSR